MRPTNGYSTGQRWRPGGAVVRRCRADRLHWCGASRHWAALDRLREQLVWYTFDEGIADDGRIPPLSPYEPTTHLRIVPRYFDDRPTLIDILRGFVEELLAGAAVAQGKQTWCEKTPFTVREHFFERFSAKVFPSSGSSAVPAVIAQMKKLVWVEGWIHGSGAH